MGTNTSIGDYIHEWLMSLFKWDAPGWVLVLLVTIGIVAFISVTVMILIWLERKVSARIQRRMGPMMAGPRFLANLSPWFGGILQSVADAIKLLTKETIIPSQADTLVFIAAPVLVFTASLLAYIVIPFGPGFIVRDLNMGFVYITAATSFSVIAIIMAGWSSNNKYSLLGGLRSAAQVISYELPLILSLLGVVMMAGTLSMTGIVKAQNHGMWYVVPQLLGFVLFIISATAELNRPPFDLPEAESELVSGFHTEYSGMGFAMFFLAEFGNMFLQSCVAVTMFLGGWLLPFGLTDRIPSTLMGIPHFDLLAGILVFFVKTYLVVLLFMWIRWTFPRLRSDQLMNFGWKVLLPLGFVNLLWTGVLVLGGPALPGVGPWIQKALGL